MKKIITLCLLITCLIVNLSAQENNDASNQFEVSIKDFSETNLIYYSFTGPYEQSFNDYGNLMAYMQQNKIPMGQYSLGIYYDDPLTVSADKLRCDVGHMVTKKVKVSGQYKIKTLPAGKAVSVRYKSMSDIMNAYQTIDKYIKEKGIKTESYSIEIYYSADPNVVDAEILMLIKK
jgi:effector-binding domain-containing protein